MPAIKYKKKTYASGTFPVMELTRAAYDALPDAKKMDGTVYMITDDDAGWEAERSTYDNTASGLTATNVQDALDELSSNGTYQTLFENVASGTEHTVPNINQYRYIWFTMSFGGNAMVVSHFVPTLFFKTRLYNQAKSVQLETNDGTRHFTKVYYTSDTKMSIETGTNMTDYKISAYGIK